MQKLLPISRHRAATSERESAFFPFSELGRVYLATEKSLEKGASYKRFTFVLSHKTNVFLLHRVFAVQKGFLKASGFTQVKLGFMASSFRHCLFLG
jgi:hypothetical protein